MNTDARTQAFFLLNKLDQRKHTLDYYLDELDRKALLPDKRERSLLNALVYGVLRQRARLDYLLKLFSAKPLSKLDYEVLNILRLALYQIAFMDRIPPSAAVNTAVEITKCYNPKATGFVNAVLRKSLSGWQAADMPDPTRNLVQFLSVEHALPQWLVSRWLKRFSRKQLEVIAKGLNDIPPLSLRANTQKISAADLAIRLADHAETAEQGIYAATAVKLTRPSGPVYDLPGYNDGLFLVQDEAAQLSVALVDPQPYESVLDACAGIGGKTLGMAIASHGEAIITATDQACAKLKHLHEETQRLSLPPVTTVEVDWLVPVIQITKTLQAADISTLFDKVLVDAPCSGLGVLRRNPDTKWARRESDLIVMSKHQTAILDHAAAFVKPGGVVVYIVCSTEPEETEQVIGKFLENNPHFFMDENYGALNPDFGLLTESASGCFCTYPACSNMDGFFMARLKRQNCTQ